MKGFQAIDLLLQPEMAGEKKQDTEDRMQNEAKLENDLAEDLEA